MASNINPSLTPVNSLANFRFWCQKVLPLVYDDSLSYYEVLGKMVVQLNDVIDNVNADTDNVLTLKDAFLELQTYVNNFFDDIDQLASYAERAEAAQTAANTSAVNAATSASNASQSSLAAMDARDTAVAARQAAETSANTASTAATNANTKANEAAQSAITAQTAQASASQSATLAATDRSAAQTAASTATTKANEANTSATNAETSAENAAQSESNAEELVNNIQENLDNIQQNTNDISDLKESVTNMATFPLAIPLRTLFQENYRSSPFSARYIIGNFEHFKIIKTGSNQGSGKYCLFSNSANYQQLTSSELSGLIVDDFKPFPKELSDELTFTIMYIPDENTAGNALYVYICYANITDDIITVNHTTRVQMSTSAKLSTVIMKNIPIYSDSEYISIFIANGGSNRTGDLYFFVDKPDATSLALSN